MPHYHQKRFSTFYSGLVAFKKWLLENNCKDVCMESTGKYWVPVWNVLEDSIHVVIANPKWVSAVKGNKDDKKDSKWIGDLFRMGLVPGSYIPSKDIQLSRLMHELCKCFHWCQNSTRLHSLVISLL